MCTFSVKVFQLHKLLEDLNELVVEVQIGFGYDNLRLGPFSKFSRRWFFVMFTIIMVATFAVGHQSLQDCMQFSTISDGLK